MRGCGRVRMLAVLAVGILGVGGAPRSASGFDVVTSYQQTGNVSGYSGVLVSCDTRVDTPNGNDVVLSSLGIGHAGGIDASWIDDGEEVRLFHTGAWQLRAGFAYRVSNAVDLDDDYVAGESFVEAFDRNESLGVRAVSGTGWIDVAALFGNALILQVDITSLDAIRIAESRYRLRPDEVVEVKLDPPASAVYADMTQCSVDFDSAQGDITLTESEGLGIAGGSSSRINAGETLRVRFPEPVAAVGYRLADAIDLGGSTVAGDHFMEAYDAEGASLGLQSANGYPDGIIELAEEYGPALLSGFDLIGVNDAFRVSSVWFAPEPGALGGVAALAVLAWQARRREGRV